MKKGVVLLMSLALIMVLSLTILKSTSVSEKYLNDANDAIFYAQFNKTFLDIVQIIKNTTSQIDDAQKFEVLIKTPLIISDEKSSIKAVLKFTSDGGKININNLLKKDKEGTKNKILIDFFHEILSEFEISDPDFLIDLILDTIDVDKKSRSFQSELVLKPNSYLNDGGILDFNTLDEILNQYHKQTADFIEIPFRDFITFYGDEIDFNYLHPKIKAILNTNYGINAIFKSDLVQKDEDLLLDEDQKKLLKTLEIVYFVPRIKCELDFFYLDKNIKTKFIYDLKSKRILDIETIF